MYDATPETQGIINTFRHRDLGWRAGLREMVDNSIDAGATEIVISLNKKLISIADNGKGASLKALQAMTILGKSEDQAHVDARIGRYGIGSKDCSIWGGNSLRITSRHNEITRIVTLDWDRLRNWRFPDPKEVTHSNNLIDSRHGTTIEIGRLIRSLPKSAPKIIEGLETDFMPAIRNGLKIHVNRSNGARLTASAIDLPDFMVSDRFDFDVGAKRFATIVIGVTKPEVSHTSCGIHQIYGPRVMRAETAFGLNGYSKRRIHGELVFHGAWTLEANKSSISTVDERYLSRLEDQVEKAIRPVLELAKEESDNYNLRATLEGVNQMVDRDIGRPVRTKGTKKGTVKKRGTNRKNKTAKRVTPDPNRQSRSRRKYGGFRVDAINMGEGTVGSVDLESCRVSLNIDHGFVREMLESDNRMGIAALAGSMWAQMIHKQGSQIKFAFAEEQFDQTMASMLPQTGADI